MHVTLALAALFGFLSVACGAFGAHAMKSRLSVEHLAVWNTAAEYQMYHALVLLFIGLYQQQMASSVLSSSVVCFVLGIVIFSGSLYLLCLTQQKWLGAITPIGGTLLLIGWLILLYTFFKLAIIR